MTGEEFLNKVRAIKTITDIHWHVEGDVLDPDKVKVVIVADGEEIELTYPREDNFMQSVSMSLVINKFMEQIGNDFRTHFTREIVEAVNFSIEQIKNTKGGK